MSVNRCIVTVTDVIGPTSMPFNEFVLYRSKKYKNEKQIILLLFKDKISSDVVVPEDIEIYCIGKNIKQLKYVTEKIIDDCSANDVETIFHIHEAKSVMLFDIATHGKYRDRIIYTLHSTYKNYHVRTKILCRLASARCKAVVCVSDTSYRYYPSHLKKKYNVFSIQNGVSIERINQIYCNTQKKKNEQFQLAYVARLVALKRHNMLLEIISKVPDVMLNIIGSGPLMDELKTDVKVKRLENRIKFTGSLPRDMVYELLVNTDLYVSTSSYEGLPVSVLEAMACGIPCIVSDIEQHREIADKCSALMLASDENDWVEKIKMLIDMPAEKRMEIGNISRIEVQKFFSLDTMHINYNKVYGGRFE